MLQSPTIGAIAAALAKAQASFKPAVKDAKNDYFKAKYVSLDAVIEACRESLSVNGIAVVQLTGYEGDKLILNSMLVHSSGEFIGSTYPIKPVKDDPQGVGSAVTYARRYSLMALVGIAAEDDDGEAAHGRGKDAAATQKVASVTGEVVKKKPDWNAEETAKLGAANAAFINIGAEGWFMSHNYRMKYDKPADVLDFFRSTLAKWTKEQKEEANAMCMFFYDSPNGAELTLKQEAIRWDWTVPTDVLDAMTALKAKCG